MSDTKSPYIENNYFNQEWISGTLSNIPDKSIYIDELKNPTDENEKNYANVLQNYYIYKPLTTQEDSITDLTSFYIPNPELFNILEVFKPLDQGHDFNTSQRNVSGNWTLPSFYNFNDNTINSYNQFQANTSFGGGSNIFGLICIEEDSYNFLKQNDEILNINNLLNIINNDNRLNVYENFKGKYGLKINFNLNQQNNLQINTITNNTEIPDNKNGDIIFLSLYTTDIYNNGMHSLWNFNKSSNVYAVNIQNGISSNNLIFNGYLLYKCNNIVPELHVSIQNILDNYVNNNSELKSLINLKGNKLYNALIKKLSDKDNVIKDFELSNKNNKNYTDIKLNRGYSLVFTDFKVDDVSKFTYPKQIKDLVITYLLKKYYSNLSPVITDNYKPLIELNNTIINDSRSLNTENNIYKIPVSIIDANPSPNESSLITSLRNLDNDDELYKYPYKYSIVSINVDGSGLGGQISTSYHPPELSIYMTIFDSNNKFYGFIYRICILKKINSNILNSKAIIDVDMHYCFFNINQIEQFVSEQELTGSNLDNIKEISSKLNDYILKNTKIDENMTLRTNINNTDNIGKAWYKFTLVSDAPSVLNINKAVKDIEKYIKINRDNIQIGQKGDVKQTMLSNFNNSISNLVSSIASNIYNTINLNAESKDPNGLNNIISTAIKIYWSDGILKNIYPDINNFVKIFLIRNKYIGDNSRATDTLYYNKEAIMQPIQISNDENTLSTAKLVNVSSILASPGSSERHIYISPYLTSKNEYIDSKTGNERERQLQEQELNKLLDEQKSSESSKIIKRQKINITIVSERKTRSSFKGGRFIPVDITQPLTPEIINKSNKLPLMEQQIIQKPDIQKPIIQKPIIPQPLPSSPPSTPSPDESLSLPSSTSSIPSSLLESEDIIPSQDLYLNNLIEYLKNISESINYINSTYINEYSNEHINDFIIKLYLSNIKENISSFSQGLTIENIISILKTYTDKSNPSLNEGLYINNTFNSIFKNFDKIQNLISSAIDIEEEEDLHSDTLLDNTNINQEGGFIAKITFESINNKMNNLFDFTQNRIEILNECYKDNLQVKDIINYYNNIILKLNNYLVGYYNDINSLDNCDIYGLDSFVGIYCFFMYFTIEFNRQLNNTSEINNSITSNDENILQQLYSGSQLLDWIQNYFQGNIELFESNDITKNYISINESMKDLPYDKFMVNDINFILQSINSKVNNSIFTKSTRDIPLQIITALKSLYYLLDENFIENYINNKNRNINELVNMTPVDFLNELYDNNLYGVIDNNKKYNFYINNKELENYITDLLYFKKKEQEQQEEQENKPDFQQTKKQRIEGGTHKNKKLNKKNKKTKNKNKKINKNKTYKKKGKKVRQNTISNK